MNGVERRGANKLHSLVERHSAINVIAQTLQVTQCSMTLVAVINLFRYPQFLQRQNTTHTQKNLLFQAVFVVTAIECMGNGAVVFRVQLIIRI